MKNRILTIIIALLLLSGLSLLLYVGASSYSIAFNARQTIRNYQSGIARMDDETCERLLAEAAAYNGRLAAMGPGMRDPTEKELEEYFSLLDPLGSGVIGYVAIEKLGISLPIYHSTIGEVSQTGVGHLPGTSLPVGGKATHCVISAHREVGLFKDIDQLEEGDIFSLRVLNETLTYEVDQILTILPTESDQLTIETGQDYCSLLTCTPYGVNTHRLVVRGHRIPTI